MSSYFDEYSQRELENKLKNFKWTDKNNKITDNKFSDYSNDLKIDYNKGTEWNNNSTLKTQGDYTGLGGGKGKAPGSGKSTGQSKWSKLNTAGKVAAGGQVLSQALNTIDMLTGGQDKIEWMGTGFQMPTGYNPDMYIGRGV